MRHLTVGVFHDDALGSELGKKGTLSDIAMFNRRSDDTIFTFMLPVEDKLTAKSQIISVIDAAVIVFSQMTREIGETIVMLDLMGVSRGIAVTTPFGAAEQILALISKTSIRSFSIAGRDPVKLLENLRGMLPERDTASRSLVTVDHSFSVKGVGEVALGFVKQGVVKKYDKMSLLPIGKEVIIRSIQVQDEDAESAEAGTRVGLAIKGANLEEMSRGSVLTTSADVHAESAMQVAFTRSPFYTDELKDGLFHATLGMQTGPVTIDRWKEGKLSIRSSKPIACQSRDMLLLLDLNAKKTRVVGRGQCE